MAPRDKGKQRAQPEPEEEPTVIDAQLSDAEAGPFHLVAAFVDIPLAPRFHRDIHGGIEQVLAKWLTK